MTQPVEQPERDRLDEAAAQNPAFVDLIKNAEVGPVARQSAWTLDEIKAWLASPQ
jgi:hypothetical protein